MQEKRERWSDHHNIELFRPSRKPDILPIWVYESGFAALQE